MRVGANDMGAQTVIRLDIVCPPPWKLLDDKGTTLI